MPAKAGETTTVTVTAIDANRRAVPEVALNLSADSGIITSATADSETDAQGKLTANYEVGADRGNRDVTIRASSGNVSSVVVLRVEGTAVALTASPAIATSATTPVEITATVADAGGVGLPGVVLTFNTTGGSLSGTTASTDATGTAKVILTGVAADVVVTASGANATAQVPIKAGSTTLPDPAPAGIVIKDVTIQANPAVVGPNLSGGQLNFSQLDVRVTGDLGAALGIPVENARVRLRIASSPPFGTLSIDTSVAPVLTNASGSVSARFIPGAATTGTDQVVVCASIDGVGTLPGDPVAKAPCAVNEKQVKLTISAQPLFVRISTHNLILKVNNDLDYEKPFSIYVTDAAGRGVPGANVSVRLLPFEPTPEQLAADPPWKAYRKGRMAYVMNRWTPTWLDCDNEDKNFNGVLDTGDNDLNMDGKLYPGQSAAFTLTNSGVTDSAGFVNMTLRYGQRFAFWATYQIEARASTAGSERLTTFNYRLDGAESDYTSNSFPGFGDSPFGVVLDCTSPF
jgi:hypothetical protein